MIRKIRQLLLIFILLVSVSAVWAGEQTDRQIGIIYIKNAVAKYLLGEYEAASDLLVKAEEFYSTSSDYSYLNGLIVLERDNNINAAEGYFIEALASADWLLLETRECVSDLAMVMFRKKEYQEVITLIDNNYQPDYRDNDLMYLYVLSLRNTGRREEYTAGLWKSIRRHTDDYRFALLLIHESDVYRNEIIDRAHLFKNKVGGLSVFLEAVLLMEDGPEKIRKLGEYLELGGREPEALIEYYRLNGTITADDLKRLLADGILENPLLSKELIRILPTAELSAIYHSAVEVYTGNVYHDLNGDGYYEQLCLYDGGRTAGISVDGNQDGVLEKMIIFENGKPVELIVSEGSFIRINYDNYPFVDEISIADGGGMDVYTFLANTVRLDFYKEKDGLEKPFVDDELISGFISEPDEYRNNVLKIASYTGGAAKDSFSFLRQEWERRDENSSILRIYNRLYGNYVYLNRYDEKTTGFGDVDYDSLIDLKETYSGGRLISIEADENKNGIYDYKLSLEGGESVSFWDFNEDGIFDCRQRETEGTLITEFSSELNGVFDIIERK